MLNMIKTEYMATRFVIIVNHVPNDLVKMSSAALRINGYSTSSRENTLLVRIIHSFSKYDFIASSSRCNHAALFRIVSNDCWIVLSPPSFFFPLKNSSISRARSSLAKFSVVYLTIRHRGLPLYVTQHTSLMSYRKRGNDSLFLRIPTEYFSYKSS